MSGSPQTIVPNFDPDVRNLTTESFRSLQAVLLTMSKKPAIGNGGACYGDSGSGPFLPNSDVLVGLYAFTDIVCREMDRAYRLDTARALAFLVSQGVSLP